MVIEEDELEKLRTKSDRSINIEGFVAPEALDPVYHAGRTYYLVPDGAVGQKPYQLLLQGMEERGVHALAQVVVQQREQLVLLRSMDGVLTMTILNHQMKVKMADSFKDEISEEETSAEELKLTTTLINASMIENFDFSSYTDRYIEKLTELIQLKVDGEEVVQVPDAEEPKIINLMEALKKSVAEAQSAAEAEAVAAATEAVADATEVGDAAAVAPKRKPKAAAGKKQAPSAKTKRDSGASGTGSAASRTRERKAG